MDLNIRILSDAAEAMEKFAGVFERLGMMFVRAFGKGVQLSDYTKLRDTHRKLTSLIILTNDQVQTQGFKYIPAIQRYLKYPSPSLWLVIQKLAADSQRNLALITGDLSVFEQEIAAEDYYSELTGAVMSRQMMLSSLETMEAPVTPEELRSLREYVDQYMIMIEKLSEVNKAMAEHIKQFRAEGKWPASMG